MNVSLSPKRPRLKIQPTFEVIERTADPSVMNWAVNRYCEWLLRRYLNRDSQLTEKNGRL
jgi:hypothetical protein